MVFTVATVWPTVPAAEGVARIPQTNASVALPEGFGYCAAVMLLSL